uniref:THAP-type domain-containing protein n=1 Tax=Salarias fasciatus TaxID=181472 RepID=A0A672GYY3_SALFA
RRALYNWIYDILQHPLCQKRWVVNIRRANFIVKSSSRVCSRHFQSSDQIEPPTPAGRRRLKPGAVPLLFQWNNFTVPAPRPGVWERTERPSTEPMQIAEPSEEALDHDYCASAEPAALDLSLHHAEELRAEIARLKEQLEEITISSKFCLERFAGSDEDIRFFTSQSQCILLQPIDEFFLFMNYLSLGLMEKDLAHRFKIHQSTVSPIINTWANFLYTVLGAVGIWLDEENIKAHLPEVFHDYADTQVILDCTELRCQTPNSLLLLSEVFSGYKSHCTFKGLIGVAPHGPVTFISSLYQGSISDKEILKQSGIVALMNPSMAIMVDKGLLVEDCVPCKVHIPTFLSKRAQLSGPEVRKTQSIARLRVHVERLIRRFVRTRWSWVRSSEIASAVFRTQTPGGVEGPANHCAKSLFTPTGILKNIYCGKKVA